MPHVDLPQAEFKVVLLGDTFTGKTSLVLRFAEGYYRESARSATVGAFFITKRLTVPSVGLTCKIQIWDTAGQEQFKPLAPMYYQSAAAAICCFDPFHQKSIDTLKYWLEELHRNVPAGRIVIAMAACKCDLLQQQQPQQPQPIKDPVQSQPQDHPHSPQQPGSVNISMNTVPTNNTTQATLVKTALANLREVEELAAHMGAIFVPTSAKTNDNVTELFSRVAERVLQFQKHSKFAADPATAIPVTLGGGTVHCRSTPSSPSSSPRTAHATAGSSSHRSKSTGSLLSNNNHNSNGRTGSRSPIPSSLEQPSLFQSNQHAHQRSLSSSPTNIYGSMSRDDYLHRRNHHTSSPTPPMMGLSNHNNHNNHSNNAIPPLPDSPTRLGLPKTSAAGMNESPILASGKATLYPAEEPPPPPKGLAANLTASATLCGDTDYLNCAVMPHAGDHSMMMGKCCIL